MKKKFAIIGAGNGGLAMAGYLLLNNYTVVSIFDRYEEQIKPLREQKRLTMTGGLEGVFQLPLVTTHLGEACEDADVLVVVVPSTAHEWVAKNLASYSKPGQIILLNPGYFGGSYYFYTVFKEMGLDPEEYTIAETSILFFASRIVGPASVGIRAMKKWLQYATYPSSVIEEVHKVLGPVFPQFEPVSHTLITGLNNPNPVIHVPLYLLNLGRVHTKEASKGFDYHSWITPEIQRAIKEIDDERVALIRELGLPSISLKEWGEKTYQRMERYYKDPDTGIPDSSSNFPPRYLTEDVPMGLIPFVSLGEMLGLEMPITRSFINIANTVHGVDYWKIGRTMAYLGIEAEGKKEFLEYFV